MKRVELYGRVRHSVLIEGKSRRETALNFGIDRRWVASFMLCDPKNMALLNYSPR